MKRKWNTDPFFFSIVLSFPVGEGGGGVLFHRFLYSTYVYWSNCPSFCEFSNNAPLPENGQGGGGKTHDRERTWLEITEEHSEEIYRKSTLLSHLIISEWGTQAGYLKGVPASSLPVSPHQETRTEQGMAPKRREKSRLKRKAGGGQGEVGTSKRRLIEFEILKVEQIY